MQLVLGAEKTPPSVGRESGSDLAVSSLLERPRIVAGVPLAIPISSMSGKGFGDGTRSGWIETHYGVISSATTNRAATV